MKETIIDKAEKKYPKEDYPSTYVYRQQGYIEGMSQAIEDYEETHTTSLIIHANNKVDYELQRLYDWLMDEDREPAKTRFTAGLLRNVASEIEFRIKKK